MSKLQYLPGGTVKLSGNPEVTLEKQFLISLWYLANIESFRSVANRFGVAKSTAWKCLSKIIHILLELNARLKIIAFPNEEHCHTIINTIKQKTKFPGVVGAVDGTHIPIIAPKENPASYVNRKNFHSILLQGTCDNKKLFIHCYAGEAGSIHDACLYRRSGLVDILNNINIPQDGHLLGDSAYPLSTKLLTPFKNNGHLTNIHNNYNKLHAKTRVVIEQAFALLKGRFRRLKLCETRRLDLLPVIIMAGCILHNLCILADDVPDDLNLDRELEKERLMNVNIVFDDDNEDRITKRDDIANALYLEALRRDGA